MLGVNRNLDWALPQEVARGASRASHPLPRCLASPQAPGFPAPPLLPLRVARRSRLPTYPPLPSRWAPRQASTLPEPPSPGLEHRPQQEGSMPARPRLS